MVLQIAAPVFTEPRWIRDGCGERLIVGQKFLLVEEPDVECARRGHLSPVTARPRTAPPAATQVAPHVHGCGCGASSSTRLLSDRPVPVDPYVLRLTSCWLKRVTSNWMSMSTTPLVDSHVA